MKLINYVFYGIIAFVLLFGAANAFAECGSQGSIEQVKQQFVDNPDVNGTVIELNSIQIDGIVSKLGPPPVAEIEKWYLIRTNSLGAIALVDHEGCIRGALGPAPRQAIMNLIGIEDVGG